MGILEALTVAHTHGPDDVKVTLSQEPLQSGPTTGIAAVDCIAKTRGTRTHFLGVVDGTVPALGVRGVAARSGDSTQFLCGPTHTGLPQRWHAAADFLSQSSLQPAYRYRARTSFEEDPDQDIFADEDNNPEEHIKIKMNVRFPGWMHSKQAMESDAFGHGNPFGHGGEAVSMENPAMKQEFQDGEQVGEVEGENAVKQQEALNPAVPPEELPPAAAPEPAVEPPEVKEAEEAAAEVKEAETEPPPGAPVNGPEKVWEDGGNGYEYQFEKKAEHGGGGPNAPPIGTPGPGAPGGPNPGDVNAPPPGGGGFPPQPAQQFGGGGHHGGHAAGHHGGQHGGGHHGGQW